MGLGAWKEGLAGECAYLACVRTKDSLPTPTPSQHSVAGHCLLTQAWGSRESKMLPWDMTVQRLMGKDNSVQPLQTGQASGPSDSGSFADRQQA